MLSVSGGSDDEHGNVFMHDKCNLMFLSGELSVTFY